MVATKKSYLKRLSDENGVISALAIDQRGALKKMMSKYQETEVKSEQISNFKKLVSEELTKYAASILLDPEFGLDAAQVRAENAGLLLAYEKTGYDVTTTSRLPDCLPEWSVKRLKELGADACKFLLYYDVDGSCEINNQKKAYIERIGAECVAEGLPFFLEILSYDEKIADNNTPEYAKVKPRKVLGAMEVFSDKRFQVDILKVEVPIDMKYVEGFAQGQVLYSREEAATFFKQQSDISELPYIFLSAGVSSQLFQETLEFAHEAGAEFNGVLCGRATWADSVEIYITQGEEATREWLRAQGRQNIEELNQVLGKTATACKFFV